MRIHLATLLALLLAAPLAAQTVAADSALNDVLRRELLEMGRLDQEVRQGITPERVRDTAYVRRMSRVDSAHTVRMWEIIRDHGWPGISRVGPEAAGAAFLLVQHTADNDLQREALRLMQAAPPGEVSLPDLALITDRVRVRQGLPQLYGSQFNAVDGRWIADPIEDVARLDRAPRFHGPAADGRLHPPDRRDDRRRRSDRPRLDAVAQAPRRRIESALLAMRPPPHLGNVRRGAEPDATLTADIAS